MLPILHLNGYKIANPTVLARIPEDELLALLPRLRLRAGHRGRRRATSRRARARALRGRARRRRSTRSRASRTRRATAARPARPRWPMIVLRTPKGWTGPKEVDGKPIEGTWRSHQVPLADVRDNPEHLRLLEEWLRSYRPEELFDDERRARRRELARARRRGRAPHEREPARQRRRAAARPRRCPTSATTPSTVDEPGTTLERGDARARRVPARRDRARTRTTFRLFGPDETASNRLGAVFEVDRPRVGWPRRLPTDEHLAPDGRVMEVLSRAPLPGLARGLPADRPARPLQLLRGVHPHHRLDVQPAREVAEGDARASRGGGRSRRSTTCSRSHVWRQDHNGFSHQDPGFIDHVVNKKAEVIRVYLPPDANMPALRRRPLPAQPRLRQRDRRRQAAGAQLPLDRRGDRALHARRSASGTGPRTTTAASPTSCMACCGDVPTLETLAAVALLREHLPELKVRVVNVVDLMRLQPRERASARPVRPRVRRALHHRPAGRSSPTTATRG